MDRKNWGLVRSRVCLVPTLRGWLVIFVSFVLIAILTLGGLHSFLAVNDPVQDGLLVIEGWAPDYCLELAVDEVKRHHYPKVYVTGGPLEVGGHLSRYGTYAQLGAATLIQLGLDSNVVQAVPAPRVRSDRTYTAAVALRKWLLEHNITPSRIQLLSEGPHARRSRLLYEMAMGKEVVVGVTAIPSNEYDAHRWWRYSAGVRNVIGEGLAYLYARFLFFPPQQ